MSDEKQKSNEQRQKLAEEIWNKICPEFRSEGIHISNYIDEISGLLFLKMYEESNRYNDYESNIPEGAKWENLLKKAEGGQEQPLEEKYKDDFDNINKITGYYKAMIKELSEDGPLMSAGFTGFQTDFSDNRGGEERLKRVVKKMENLDIWEENNYDDEVDYAGLAYEDLLKRYADNADGAGQYFTKRRLIKAMVEFIEPEFGDKIHDPAAGTGGFLIEAYKYVLDQTDNYTNIDTKDEEVNDEEIKDFEAGITGIELVPETRRLGLLNMLTHRMKVSVDKNDNKKDKVDGFVIGDSLRDRTYNNNKISKNNDIILANPPFGSNYDGEPDFNSYLDESNKIEIIFLQQIMDKLGKNGKAAVIVPEGTLFASGSASNVRKRLLKNYNLECILALPENSFHPYAGVDANVLFFENESDENSDFNTESFFYYDCRTDFDAINKSNRLDYDKHLYDFVKNRKDKKDTDKYFEVSIDDVDKDDYELHLKKYKEFKYEGHRPPKEIAQDIQDELNTIETELDQMVGDENDK